MMKVKNMLKHCPLFVYFHLNTILQQRNWAVVVAQLVERLLPLPEVCGSNSVFGKNLFVLNICVLKRRK